VVNIQTKYTVTRINQCSANLDLDRLITIAEQAGESPPGEIRQVLPDALCHHYHQLWVEQEAERQQDYFARIVDMILTVLTVYKRLDPAPDKDIQYSGWLHTLAELQEDTEARRLYLEQALATNEQACQRYPNVPGLLIQKMHILTTMLLTGAVPGTAPPVRRILDEVTPFHPEVANRVIAAYDAAVHMCAPYDPDVVLIGTDEFLSVWDETGNLLTHEGRARLHHTRATDFLEQGNDQRATHANRDYGDLARLQLKCGLTEEAWASLTEWNKIIREQATLWGYLPRNIGEFLQDPEVAPLFLRLEQLLQENKERT
jgi:hypothetical protein